MAPNNTRYRLHAIHMNDYVTAEYPTLVALVNSKYGKLFGLTRRNVDTIRRGSHIKKYKHICIKDILPVEPE
jgi:hypothetical protein